LSSAALGVAIRAQLALPGAAVTPPSKRRIIDNTEEAMPLTQELGRFVAGLKFERLPSEAVEIARTGIIDTVATMIAGAPDPAPQLLQRGLAPAPGPASLYFSGETAAAPEAAWINGTAGHALDYDDVGCRGHVSTVLFPAILAEAETLGAGGRAMFAAYVAGYETWAELARRDPGHHHVKGWHPTGIFGAIGAAAACAALRRLSPEQATMALALAASQAGGIMANFGTMTKPFHAGRAAHAGVVSARLAGLGFTAAADALEHPQGFLSAVSPEGKADRERAVPPLGEAWQIVEQGISIKKYPACYCTHRALDGMLDLLAKRPLTAAEIARITVAISRTHSLILRNHAPQTGLEAKFSMEFAMAAAIIARRAGLGEYSDGFVRRPEVQELMRKVAVVTNENYDPEVSGASRWDEVTVELASGERIASDKVRRARGHAELPLSEAELFDKFRSCLDSGNARLSPERLFDRLRRLESITARELTATG
jgi:2-methylcitrate dehydratase PrpD